MIVYEPEKQYQNNEIVLSARIEVENKLFGPFPSHLYYAFPQEFEPYLNLRIDAFAFSMVISAMRLGENLEIKGRISPRLAIGLREHVKIFSHVYKHLPLKEIQLNFDGFETSVRHIGKERFGATSFSGGVDSTHMCWMLNSKNNPVPFTNFKYAFFIHGLDNPLDDRAGFQALADKFKSFLEPEGIALITPRTNFIQFTQLLLPWPSVCSVPVLSAAMLIDGLIQQYIMPSTYSYDRFHITGSSMISDHWISTEEFETFHFGSHSYLEKLETITAIPSIQSILRVCSRKRQSLKGNCSSCNKCLRLMSFLYLTGKYADFTCFKQPFSLLDLIRWGWEDYSAPEFKQIFIQSAFRKRKILLGMFGILSAWISAFHQFLRHALRRVLPQKTFFALKTKIYSVDSDIQL